MDTVTMPIFWVDAAPDTPINVNKARFPVCDPYSAANRKNRDKSLEHSTWICTQNAVWSRFQLTTAELNGERLPKWTVVSQASTVLCFCRRTTRKSIPTLHVCLFIQASGRYNIPGRNLLFLSEYDASIYKPLTTLPPPQFIMPTVVQQADPTPKRDMVLVRLNTCRIYVGRGIGDNVRPVNNPTLLPSTFERFAHLFSIC